MKTQVETAFKGYFVNKKHLKSKTVLHNALSPNNVQWGAISHFKINPFILIAPHFRRIFQTDGLDKENDKIA